MRQIVIIAFILFCLAGFVSKVQAAGAPIISTQPLSAIVNIGKFATFTVVATGSGASSLAYQWKISTNGGNNWAPISGATSASYTTAPTTLSNSGTQYECTVTNAAGGVSSNVVTLVVMPNPICAPFLTSSYFVNVKNSPFNAQGNGFTDDTAAIQGAVNNVLAHPGGGTVYVPNGTYMINVVASNLGIKLGSNMIFYMSPGAILKVMPNNLTNYAVITIGGMSGSISTNVSVVGGTLMGDKYTHTGATGEWGMGVNVIGATSGVVIEDVTSMDMWGDGFYMGSNNAGQTNTNITMCDDISNDNRRQGMSIVQANGVNVESSTFAGTSGTSPQAGIDIEPDAGDTVNNVKITHSLFEYNNYTGFTMYSGAQGSSINNVLFADNIISGNVGGIVINNPSNGLVTIDNNMIEDSNAYGIWVMTNGNNIVTGNIITYSGSAIEGIYNTGNAGNIITPNTCNGSRCSCSEGISC